MNEVINGIVTRRSVRDFSDKLVAKADIEELLNVALYAPSGMGRQTWKFTGVLNQGLIRELAEIIGHVWDREGYEFYKAPALIIASNEADSIWGKEDNACALQNIFLAAHSKGIGSVWINQLNGKCDVPEIRAILQKLNIPDNHVVYGLAALGYSMSEPMGAVKKTGITEIIE